MSHAYILWVTCTGRQEILEVNCILTLSRYVGYLWFLVTENRKSKHTLASLLESTMMSKARCRLSVCVRVWARARVRENEWVSEREREREREREKELVYYLEMKDWIGYGDNVTRSGDTNSWTGKLILTCPLLACSYNVVGLELQASTRNLCYKPFAPCEDRPVLLSVSHLQL